jgi:hypothetical protein
VRGGASPCPNIFLDVSPDDPNLPNSESIEDSVTVDRWVDRLEIPKIFDKGSSENKVRVVAMKVDVPRPRKVDGDENDAFGEVKRVKGGEQCTYS